MILLAVLLLCVGFVAWRMAKRRRSVVLAGLDAEKPTYAVPPPARSVGKRSTEAL